MSLYKGGRSEGGRRTEIGGLQEEEKDVGTAYDRLGST